MVSVSKPLRYKQLLSRNRYYGIIVSTWIFGAAVATSGLILSPTWNTVICWFTFEAHNIGVSALVLVLYLVSLVCPEPVLAYASEGIFLVVVRTDSIVSAQVQSISGDADELGIVTPKAMRSARNVQCHLLCSSGSFSAILCVYDYSLHVTR